MNQQAETVYIHQSRCLCYNAKLFLPNKSQLLYVKLKNSSNYTIVKYTVDLNTQETTWTNLHGLIQYDVEDIERWTLINRNPIMADVFSVKPKSKMEILSCAPYVMFYEFEKWEPDDGQFFIISDSLDANFANYVVVSGYSSDGWIQSTYPEHKYFTSIPGKTIRAIRKT